MSLTGADADLDREFEARLVETSTLAFRVAYSVLRHRQDAEDVAQGAFAKAYRNFRQLRDRDRFRAWLVRMTWRMAIDQKRSERRRLAREAALDAPAAPSGLESADARERAERLWRAIDALPEKLRVVIVLASMKEPDVAEAGSSSTAGNPAGSERRTDGRIASRERDIDCRTTPPKRACWRGWWPDSR